MADLSVTAANVRSYGLQVQGISGEALTAGQAVRKNTSQQWVRAQSNSAVNSATTGIVLNTAPGANQPVTVHVGGPIDPGGTALAGKVYVQSATAGGIAPVDDIVAGMFTTVLGIGQASPNRINTIFSAGNVAAAADVT